MCNALRFTLSGRCKGSANPCMWLEFAIPIRESFALLLNGFIETILKGRGTGNRRGYSSLKLDQFLSLTGSWSWAIGKSVRGSSKCH